MKSIFALVCLLVVVTVSHAVPGGWGGYGYGAPVAVVRPVLRGPLIGGLGWGRGLGGYGRGWGGYGQGLGGYGRGWGGYGLARGGWGGSGSWGGRGWGWGGRRWGANWH